MAAPTCKAKLQTILGMANYLAKFANNISNIQPQSEMFLKRTLDFYGTRSKTAFNKMKEVIIKVPFLAFYDPKKKLNLEVDSSKRATGATLMQGETTEYASRASAENQQGWAPIERKMLATVHGCERFRLHNNCSNKPQTSDFHHV